MPCQQRIIAEFLAKEFILIKEIKNKEEINEPYQTEKVLGNHIEFASKFYVGLEFLNKLFKEHQQEYLYKKENKNYVKNWKKKKKIRKVRKIWEKRRRKYFNFQNRKNNGWKILNNKEKKHLFQKI